MNTEIQEVQLNRYPTYKDSGIEWLGKIPEHWKMLSNKFIFNLKKNLVGKKSKNYELLSLTLRGIVKRNIEDGGKFPAEYDTYQEVKEGDFVFCLFDVEETPRCIGLSKYEGMITGAYTVMESKKSFNSSFLYYFYLNLDTDKRLRPLYTGLRNTISKNDFFAFKTFIPPLSEQTAIANFLDDKCAKIDAAVEIKQQQIELLKERRQIAIHQAVTQGLNKNVPMKDSGVEWIGKIPEHWEVKRFKHLYADTFSGGTPSTEVLSFWDGGISWVSSVDVKMAYLSETSRNISELGLVRSSAKIAPKGSVIIVTRSGILQHTLPIAILMKSMAINQDVKCFVVREKLLSPDYLLSYIQGKNNEILVETRKQGATVESIEMEDFSNMIIPLPELNEQFLIVEHIKKMTSKIDSAISIYEQEIEKLKEYKTILINSAVTGKIKVNC